MLEDTETNLTSTTAWFFNSSKLSNLSHVIYVLVTQSFNNASCEKKKGLKIWNVKPVRKIMLSAINDKLYFQKYFLPVYVRVSVVAERKQ